MPSEIFVSSTCWDLVDSRAELGKLLTDYGFGVRMSDDYESLFEVNPNLDSIASCLENVEKSDVILCLIDRRYGPLLPRSYGGMSATECEIQRATQLGKPIFTFIRRNMERDFETHREGAGKLLWTTETDDLSNPRHGDRLSQFMRFIGERRRLPKTTPQSNWVDNFETIVDLKPMVLRRLLKFGPGAVVRALSRPDQFVRICHEDHGSNNNHLRFRVVNLGKGPLYNLRITCSSGGLRQFSYAQGGLCEGSFFPWREAFKMVEISPRTGAGRVVYEPAWVKHEYEAATGHRCKVEVRYDYVNSSYTLACEEFFVDIANSGLVGLPSEWLSLTKIDYTV